MEAKVTWKGRMSFEGAAGSGFKAPLGTEKLVGGDEDGFRPMELLIMGLAGCTAMDVISILTKKRQVITAFEVKVEGQRATEHPRVFTHITIEYVITGHQVDPEAVERAIELSATKYCPAQAMFGRIVPIDIKKTILEG
ncbi:MAG: OsmC family protein [Anaerolineae bacterium]|nr:OsmC family protein [Anaerolineae bacterium]